MSNIAIDKFHVYIGCLHHSIGDEELLTLAKCFSNHVVCSKVIRNPATGSHLGYGFVQYDDLVYADEAITKMHGVVAKGIPLHIRPAYSYTSTEFNSEKEEAQDIKNTTVYVTEMGPNDTEETLRELAKYFGDIECISVITNRRFGFVTYTRREYALGFICHMDSWNTGETTITCSWAYQHKSIGISNDYTHEDAEKEDEIHGSKYAIDLLPKKLD
ncbi:hypothetical protein BEWA_031670 [Theileria equi strain WA]|uniref:RRM domain-containing protein n=1 Tax=Theileria equi strain WA TaxID=1537102 RepID=L0AZI8_THEEQ|nr:hypothetical protein BEWA_031670 [Theileria equi strain WA]AFZ80314.1 hypothetical protein BEWA_031670 [Theileria equi strain WA]|eukprot:XP_004829980.1 hypothetical protein BEWA_031670 [Theileria equi strain WA]